MNKKQNKSTSTKKNKTMNNKEEYTSEVAPSSYKSRRKGTSKK